MTFLCGDVQYPEEKVIMFPPNMCLEANEEPRLEWTRDGELITFPLKVPSHTAAPPSRHIFATSRPAQDHSLAARGSVHHPSAIGARRRAWLAGEL
jgi:hypothetical protein